MPTIKLVLSDMDGTLVSFGSDGVTRRTLASIHALQDAGVRFGPSSGRERIDLIRFFHGDEDCIKTGILANGKLVYVDGDLVFRHPLPKDGLRELVEVIRRTRGVVLNFFMPVELHGHSSVRFGAIGTTTEEIDDMRSHLGPRFGAQIYDDFPEGDITTAAIIVDTEVVDLFEAQAQIIEACPAFDLPKSAPFVMDVLEHGWSKLQALPVLQEYLHVDVDQMAYFGDSHNDLTMMEAIPNSFCMADGIEEAKRLARWTIGSCEDDGVAVVLDSLAAHGGEIVPADWE